MKRLRPLQINSKVLVLLFTQGISLIGTRMTSVALAIWLFQTLGRTTEVLLIPFFTELPMLLFSSMVGVWIDRFDRKKTMILADFGQAVGTGVLIASIGLGFFHPWVLFVVVFLQGTLSLAQELSADVLIAQLTPEDQRVQVNSMKEMLFPASGVLAPVLAGMIYVAGGIEGVLLVDLVSFLLAVVLILTLRLPVFKVTDEEEDQGFWSSLKEGLTFIRGDRVLYSMIGFVAVVNVVINGPLELLTPYILSMTGNELFLASVLSSMGMATFVGAFLPNLLPKRVRKTRWLWIAVMVHAMALTGLGIVNGPLALQGLVILMMMPLPMINVFFKTTLQNRVPDAYKGRVFGAAYQLAYGIAPLSFLVVGPVVDHVVTPWFDSSQGPAATLWGTGQSGAMAFTLSLAGLVVVVSTIAYAVKEKAVSQ